jgi:hypothetical protein
MMELTGKVTFSKLVFDREIFSSEPANRLSAYVLLNTLANDRERRVNLGGQEVALKRGQLAHSQQTLAKLLRWGIEKVHRVLTEFQNEGLITFQTTTRTTVITVLDYDIYNPDTGAVPDAEQEANQDAEPHTVQDAEPQSNQGQKVEGGSKKVEGGGKAGGDFEVAGSVPDTSEVFAFAAGFAGEPATGAPGPIPAGYVAGWLKLVEGRREFPPRWQRALVAAWRADFRSYAAAGGEGSEKNAAKNPGAVSANVAAIQESRRQGDLRRQLREVEESIEALDQAGAPIDGQLLAMRRRLKEQVSHEGTKETKVNKDSAT